MEKMGINEEGGAGDEGTPEASDKYFRGTPGQEKSPVFELIQKLMKEKKEKKDASN